MIRRRLFDPSWTLRFLPVSGSRICGSAGAGGNQEPIVNRSTASGDGWAEGNQLNETAGVRIFIGNLPFAATDRELRDAYAAHAVVVNAEIACDPAGRSRGFGYLIMMSAEDARIVIDELGGKVPVRGRVLRAEPAKSAGPRSRRDAREFRNGRAEPRE